MKHLITVAAAAAGCAIAILAAPAAQAQPLVPGCGYDPSQYPWYNPCSGQAPWNSSNWVGANGVPGTWGPGGYTPVTQQPIPGVCTDYRAACPSS